MPSLTALIPLQYRWLAYVLVACALVSFGYVKGCTHEQDKQAKVKLAEIVKVVKVSTTINAKQNELSTAREQGKRARDAEVSTLQEKVAKHAIEIPVHPSCDIAPERVCVINEAFGVGDSTCTPEPAPAVPEPPKVDWREAHHT